uniref:Retrotransposon Copia-like N-terminal domain-containing protein n=1 Tax=Cannabis sativa TaxID=3483 RepID=A0A803QFN9_CANSA
MATDEDQTRIPATVVDLGNSSTQTNQSLQVAATKNPLEDPASLFFLHHGDNPGNTLASQPLTGQDNYVSWSRAMQLAISVKNKIRFLDGSIPKPHISEQSLYNAWYRIITL